MLLILTHENADFDAVASQLAAHKLYPEGTPLLSWRVNRNVNQFLTLFWDAFEFVRPEDWRRRRVERVLLVDTVNLPSVRGLRPDRVQVRVIDHHEPENERETDWTYQVEALGATTTIIVEMLQNSGVSLTPNEATLLLLGIHEDTGSMVYDTTTARDIQAAAWLVQQGAQLSVVRRFLNIALSSEQRDLHDRLLQEVEWITVKGLDVALAAVAAPDDFEDEISAVAHRLRDALSPDGLFLLVELKHDHVQLVARSNTDNLDVSVIARALGGGGHDRAAAATIMERDLGEVHDELLELLPSAAKPIAKVDQIMSYGVQTLTADTSVQVAAEHMQRFGHEGYPVVDNDSGQLIGLLTRRIVDRAMSHQLSDMPVSQVMKVGSFTVTPKDSVEEVQRLMIEEGWGQIPVVEEKGSERAGQLIGIVTRTDLINLLNDGGQEVDEQDVRRLMADQLLPAVWDMVQIVGAEASEMDMPVYFVGGLVRDLLLGQQPTDIDMVVEGDAIALVRRLKGEYGGEKRSHRQFGTAKWMLTAEEWATIAPGAELKDVPEAVDFVTARTEFYTQPTALPEVERGSIKLDLHRRDFTINTLAIRLDGAHLGRLLDFYGGRRDLDQGLIRVLHSLSFVDDPTRILRAVRLEQRLDFQIESRTLELVRAALPMLNRVTGDRIRNELELCLLEKARVPLMKRLDELDVLTEIHRSLVWQRETEASFARVPALLSDPEWRQCAAGASEAVVYFGLLLHSLEIGPQRSIMARLKVRRTTREDVLAASQLTVDVLGLPDDAQPSDIYRTLQPYSGLVLLIGLAAIGPDSRAGRHIQRYFKHLRHVEPVLDGNDLLEMGLEPGPLFGQLLGRLLDARLDGEVASEAEERALLRELMAQTEETS
ncbi:MAG: CBS domain-containing protein [Candidatus Promineifilaceae bacterium]|nr:CBS domain-containing protein [Candidatus Promineifilaceae bacterium]